MELVFKIKEIPEISASRPSAHAGAPLRLSRVVPAAVLALALEGEQADVAGSKVTLEVELFRDHEDVFVRGRLWGRLMLACSRCVEPARVALDVPIDAAFTRDGVAVDAPLDEIDVEALLAEPDSFAHDGLAIRLDEAVREMLVAELPLSPLCSPGCLGLCVRCGANQNTAEGRACGHREAEPDPDGPGALAALANIKISS